VLTVVPEPLERTVTTSPVTSVIVFPAVGMVSTASPVAAGVASSTAAGGASLAAARAGDAAAANNRTASAVAAAALRGDRCIRGILDGYEIKQSRSYVLTITDFSPRSTRLD
jgi:hypothetical protein